MTCLREMSLSRQRVCARVWQAGLFLILGLSEFPIKIKNPAGQESLSVFFAFVLAVKATL
jgi:hypothetical protein